MNTINCRIKLNDHADVAGRNITPAEVIVLRTLHDVHAGGNCILNPVAAGKALSYVPAVGDKPAQTRDRTDIEEYNRLRAKYPKREAPDKPNSSFLDPLFPGVKTGTGKLPRTFDELPENYAIGEIGVAVETPIRTQEKSEVVPVSEADAAKLMQEDAQKPEGEAAKPTGLPRAELEKKTKAELLAIADDYSAPVTEDDKKDVIIEAILKAAGYAQPAATN